MKKILVVFGTRPEAIKMCPVVLGLKQHKGFNVKTCVTAQHRDLLDQVLTLFGIRPDLDLDIMRPGQDLFDITTRVMLGLRDVFQAEQPNLVLLHGDTTTTLAGSLAAYYSQIPVGHVEAGLRTYDMHNPFPEELNRVVCDHIAALHFAPTETSRDNLLRLGVKESSIYVTGNTVIDALLKTLKQPSQQPLPVTLQPHQRLILVTTHRRENFGEPLTHIAQALLTICQQAPDVHIALPVHPNPNVKPVLEAMLGAHPQITLLPPQDYEPFCRLMQASTLILTDSGGVQEEAPALGKPVLVLRQETERPEAVAMGTVKLVGTDTATIVNAAIALLNDTAQYAAMANAVNPYGDGKAVERIVAAISQFLV